jgi:hypothetical protein
MLELSGAVARVRMRVGGSAGLLATNRLVGYVESLRVTDATATNTPHPEATHHTAVRIRKQAPDFWVMEKKQPRTQLKSSSKKQPNDYIYLTLFLGSVRSLLVGLWLLFRVIENTNDISVMRPLIDL